MGVLGKYFSMRLASLLEVVMTTSAPRASGSKGLRYARSLRVNQSGESL